MAGRIVRLCSFLMIFNVRQAQALVMVWYFMVPCKYKCLQRIQFHVEVPVLILPSLVLVLVSSMWQVGLLVYVVS